MDEDVKEKIIRFTLEILSNHIRRLKYTIIYENVDIRFLRVHDGWAPLMTLRLV